MRILLTILFLFLPVIAVSPVPAADYREDIGFMRLLETVGNDLPTGAGILVTQVEATSAEHWLPNPDDADFSGKTVNDWSGDGGYSGHATSVGKVFYGNANSMAPGVTHIDAYEVNDWIMYRFLRYLYGWQPDAVSSRVANHSWVGHIGPAYAGDMLRRLDWVVDTDEFVQVIASGGPNNVLMGSSYNATTVGRTDGNHTPGSAAVDEIYSAGRSRPDIVAPQVTLSLATPVVAGAAVLLMATGKDPALSSDPEQVLTRNRKGDQIYNAQRSEVIKAVLMAGADRFTRNASITENIQDYRKDQANCNANGLDRRFGAGQVNIENSFWILDAGEQDSLEDDPQGSGQAGPEGFDYDPSFGGQNGSNATASYSFTTDKENRLLTVALAWNIHVDGGSLYAFDGNAALYDLDLRLYDMTAGGVEVAASSGTQDNTENLYVVLEKEHTYKIQVSVGGGQTEFDWDYALAWQLASDIDGDSIPARLDNCAHTENPGQADTDADGYGNACDCDLNNDNFVDFQDFTLFKTEWLTTGEALEADFNADGIVDFQDFTIFKSRWLTAGPYE